jgi:hypothetical protein
MNEERNFLDRAKILSPSSPLSPAEWTTISRDEIEDEARIVWLRDPATLAYVRQSLVITGRRANRPPANALPECAAELCGYAVLRPDSPTLSAGLIYRRVFWLKDYDRPLSDRGPYSRGGAPAEGVDPLTVAPGEPGCKNERAVTFGARVVRQCPKPRNYKRLRKG